MAIAFSPLSEEELRGPFSPVPRQAFLMSAIGAATPQLDATIINFAKAILRREDFTLASAATNPSTKDFLLKIINMIRSSGIGIAVFSEFTAAKTLANIFYEVGLCSVLGKPILLVKSETAAPPSDFVRTEWVVYKEKEITASKKNFRAAVKSVKSLSEYYRKLGDIVFEAQSRDHELAFERFQQAVLIADDDHSLRRILLIRDQLSSDGEIDGIAGVHRSRLNETVSNFCRFLPAGRIARIPAVPAAGARPA